MAIGNDWCLRSAAGPSPRRGAAMAYDSCRNATILFGGIAGGPPASDETWEWDGTSWTLHTPSGPTGRESHRMAFDSTRCVVVLFGGTDGNGAYLGDTWEWDGNSWTQANPSTNPPTRSGAAMAYDPDCGVTVMFGGWNGSRDTAAWEWDGTNWLSFTPATRPSGRDKHAMVYDAALQDVVLFGGKVNTGPFGPDQNDTWRYDCGSHAWTQVSTTVQPSQRGSHAMTYDAARARVVLFGGEGPASGTVVHGDTWEWSGADWSQVAPIRSPSARHLTASAYDSVREETVVFGGATDVAVGSLVADTWPIRKTRRILFQRCHTGASWRWVCCCSRPGRWLCRVVVWRGNKPRMGRDMEAHGASAAQTDPHPKRHHLVHPCRHSVPAFDIRSPASKTWISSGEGTTSFFARSP